MGINNTIVVNMPVEGVGANNFANVTFAIGSLPTCFLAFIHHQSTVNAQNIYHLSGAYIPQMNIHINQNTTKHILISNILVLEVQV